MMVKVKVSRETGVKIRDDGIAFELDVCRFKGAPEAFPKDVIQGPFFAMQPFCLGI